jgi:hypothetical protein
MSPFFQVRLFLRIWFQYYEDAIMRGADWAKKEYRGRMLTFK